ncbi:MAG: hypothetical protein AB2693_32515, partial [Candidatus Thiodiazotropha sp.]
SCQIMWIHMNDFSPFFSVETIFVTSCLFLTTIFLPKLLMLLKEGVWSYRTSSPLQWAKPILAKMEKGFLAPDAYPLNLKT